MRHVAYISNKKDHLFLSLVPPLERVAARCVTLFLIGSTSRSMSLTCTLVLDVKLGAREIGNEMVDLGFN